MNRQATVLRHGLASMQVCVLAEWTDEQVKEFADTENPSGLGQGWTIRRQGDAALAEADERVLCDSARQGGWVHIMLDC